MQLRGFQTYRNKQVREPTWVPLSVVQVIHAQQIAEYGGLSGIRDQGLLLSALARPRNLLAYGENINLYDLAAAYAYGIVCNHPFIDGNKRTGLAVALTFLLFNDAPLVLEEVEAAVAMEMLATGELTQEHLAALLQGMSLATALRLSQAGVILTNWIAVAAELKHDEDRATTPAMNKAFGEHMGLYDFLADIAAVKA